MPKFNLPKDTLSRLKAQFELFASGRVRVRELVEGYIADYRSYNGFPADKKHYLREKYKKLATSMSHLVFDREIWWGAADLGIVLDRDNSAITRTMRKIESTDGFRVRLYELRREGERGAYVYKKEIFELIIDFYEHEYLERFISPRHGDPLPPETAEEVYRYWGILNHGIIIGR